LPKLPTTSDGQWLQLLQAVEDQFLGLLDLTGQEIAKAVPLLQPALCKTFPMKDLRTRSFRFLLNISAS
jgi:hypothetical protein